MGWAIFSSSLLSFLQVLNLLHVGAENVESPSELFLRVVFLSMTVHELQEDAQVNVVSATSNFTKRLENTINQQK